MTPLSTPAAQGTVATIARLAAMGVQPERSETFHYQAAGYASGWYAAVAAYRQALRKLPSAPSPESLPASGVEAVDRWINEQATNILAMYRFESDDDLRRAREAFDILRARLPNCAALTEDRGAWRDVISERRRQIEREGWTPEHDDEHGNGEMARAAASYALEHAAWTYTETPSSRLMEAARSVWPWGREWWKPGAGRRMLVKAAALILAEIERLDRKEGAR